MGLALLAPVTAELLQAYLGDLGGPLGVVFVAVFLAPLYGGAALLIRELTVRKGAGWPGRLLLATAFGVAMPTLVDISLFTPHRNDIDHWDESMTSTVVGGISVYALVTWVGGHVLTSVSAPLVLVETLVEDRGPWLGRIGVTVTALLMVGIAVAVHHDPVTSNHVSASALDYGVSAVVVAGLVAPALTRLGRPLTVSSDL